MRIKNFLARQAARAGVLMAAGAMLLGLVPAANAAGNNNMKIYAFYGAGDLAKSEYAQDTLILFNPTQAPITMNGWSIQRGVATTPTSAPQVSTVTVSCNTATPQVCSANNNFFKLPTVTVPAGGYFTMAVSSPAYISGVGCVSSSNGATGNCTFPYDYRYHSIENTYCDDTKTVSRATSGRPVDCSSADNILSSTADFVMLVNNQVGATFSKTSGSNCVSSSNVVDYLGVGNPSGTAATCWEGTGYALYNIGVSANQIAYPLGTVRKNPCVDTDNNDQDFTNSSLPTNFGLTGPRTVCPTSGTQLLLNSAAITQQHVHSTDTITVTANVTAATAGGKPIVTVYATDLGGPVTGTPLYDDGTHGDAVAGDGNYTNSAFVVPFTPVTAYYLTVVATDSTGVQSRSNVYLPLENGTFTITSTNNSYSATIAPGGLVQFPIKTQGLQGYFGYVNEICLNVPSRLQCVITPPTADLHAAPNASANATLTFSAGTTVPSAILSKNLPLALAGMLAAMLLAVGIWRRKHLPLASLLALVAFMSLGSTGCETNAGLGDTNTPPGTYTMYIQGADNFDPTITSTTTYTITVK